MNVTYNGGVSSLTAWTVRAQHFRVLACLDVIDNVHAYNLPHKNPPVNTDCGNSIRRAKIVGFAYLNTTVVILTPVEPKPYAHGREVRP